MDEGDSPMCRAALTSLAAPGLLACSVCAMTRRKTRSTRMSVHASRCISQSLINKEDGANPIHQRCQIGM